LNKKAFDYYLKPIDSWFYYLC